MRTMVFGDIHGGMLALSQLITRANITPKDHLIFLGDYVDGWSQAYETIEFLIQLKNTHRCTFIRGNHDELCRDWLAEGVHNPTWLMHGGEATRKSYQKVSSKDKARHIDFLNQLQNYHLDEENRLFLHAGFTHLKGVNYEYFEKLLYWDRTLWELAKGLDISIRKDDDRYPKRLLHYNEIFIGHSPLSKTESVLPTCYANVWNMDTGAAFRGALSCMEAGTKEVWQSDEVYKLYPGENGRNE